MNLIIESKLPIQSSLFDFMSTYATLKYKIGEKEYTSSFYDNTPGSYKNGLYLLVDDNIGNANNIWFDISIRNLKYQYVLK